MIILLRISDKLFLYAVNTLIYIRYPHHIIRFRRKVGYFPNVAAPGLYHEKMLWRKIFDHNPVFTTFCDKLATKAYVRSILPYAAIPETAWVGTDVGKIPQDLDKSRFVLKGNHGVNINYFFNRQEFNPVHLTQITENWLNTTFGVEDHQWGYADAQKLLFLEELIDVSDGDELVEISVRASNRKPILCSAYINNKLDNMKYGYFGIHGERIYKCNRNIPQQYMLSNEFELPACFNQAVEYASLLSKNIDYARYDFICAGEKLYVGEITVYPAAGLTHYIPHTCDDLINEQWDISTSWFLCTRQQGWKDIYANILLNHLDSQMT